MKFSHSIRAVLFAALAFMFAAAPGAAQTVTVQPNFVAPRTVLDMGNGPMEIMPITGNAAFFTSSGSGVGSTSGSSTALTLTAVPATAPCVGCQISGTGITSGTTVSAYAATSITLSAAMTVASSTALAWGAACPVSTQSAPVQPSASYLMMLLQAAVQPFGVPLYTQARVCAYGGNGPGMQFVNFAIGAH